MSCAPGGPGAASWGQGYDFGPGGRREPTLWEGPQGTAVVPLPFTDTYRNSALSTTPGSNALGTSLAECLLPGGSLARRSVLSLCRLGLDQALAIRFQQEWEGEQQWSGLRATASEEVRREQGAGVQCWGRAGWRSWVFAGGWGRVSVPGLSQPPRCQRDPEVVPTRCRGLSAFPSAKCAHGLKIKTLS